MRAARSERVLSYIVLILFAAQALVPILYVLALSLGPQTIGETSWGHLDNYASAWEQGRLSVYMKNSVVIAVLVVALALVL